MSSSRSRSAMVAAAALAGTALAGVPASGAHVSDAEEAVFRWINELPDVPYVLPWLTMQVGNVGVVVVASGVALWHGRRTLAARLLGGGVATWLVAKLLKSVIERGRPAAVIDEVIVRHAAPNGGGWVSGHAAVTAFILSVAWTSMSRRWRIVALAIASPMYLTRVYVGEHLPLDMVGGALLGIACGQLALLVPSRRTALSTRAGQEVNR